MVGVRSDLYIRYICSGQTKGLLVITQLAVWQNTWSQKFFIHDHSDGDDDDDDEHVVLLVITEEKMVREKIYAVLPFKISKTPPQH